MQCVIVGGGIAGISAAYWLAPHCRVTLIEQRSVLGGRASSVLDPESGEEVDTGQHLLMGCYRSTQRLFAGLGTAALLWRWRRWRIVFRSASGRSGVLSPVALLPGSLRLGAALARFQLLSVRDRVQLLVGMGKFVRARTTGMSVAQLLQKLRQPAAAVAAFWKPLGLATLNAELEEADAQLLQQVLRLAFLGSLEDSALVIPTRGLSVLVAPIKTWLQSYGGAVRLGVRVASILLRQGRVEGVETSDGEYMPADAVILALPPYALARLSLPLPLPTFQYSPIVTVYLWFDRSLPLPPITAFVGTTVQWMFYRQRLRFQGSSKFSACLALVVSAANALQRMPNQQLAAQLWAEVRSVFQLPMTLQPVRFRVMKEALATPLLSPPIHSQRPTVRTKIPNLFLAGDWIQTLLPATLESAAQSGEMAAQAVRQYLQQQR